MIIPRKLSYCRWWQLIYTTSWIKLYHVTLRSRRQWQFIGVGRHYLLVPRYPYKSFHIVCRNTCEQTRSIYCFRLGSKFNQAIKMLFTEDQAIKILAKVTIKQLYKLSSSNTWIYQASFYSLWWRIKSFKGEIKWSRLHWSLDQHFATVNQIAHFADVLFPVTSVSISGMEVTIPWQSCQPDHISFGPAKWQQK